MRWVLLLAALAGCKGQKADDKELMVFAAASLTDAFEAIAEDYRSMHPDVHLIINFAGSQSLRTQIENGAEPAVFASANEAHMASLAEKKLVDPPVVFAKNELAVVVPLANPAGVSSFAELVKAKRIVLAGENVPAGAYADRVIASVGVGFQRQVQSQVVSRESHVRQTLQKVVLGEADAAIVYATDAATAKVKTIAIPEEHNVVAAYPIATLTAGKNRALGEAFLRYVQSDAGRKRLLEFGFKAP